MPIDSSMKYERYKIKPCHNAFQHSLEKSNELGKKSTLKTHTHSPLGRKTTDKYLLRGSESLKTWGEKIKMIIH